MVKRYTKEDIERLIREELLKEGYADFELFLHTSGATVYIKEED